MEAMGDMMKIFFMLPFIAIGWAAGLVWNGLRAGWVMYRDYTF